MKNAIKTAILAGGQGTRLAEYFPNLPKPMIPLIGKPLLQWQVESLVKQGFVDITLIVGYRAAVIKKHFGSGEQFGANISYITEESPLGTGGALALLPREETLVLFGDVYFDVDFNRFIKFHKDKNADITIFAHPNSHPYDSDIVVIDSDSKVRKWASKKDKDRGELRNLVNAGIYVFSAGSLPIGETVKFDLDYDIIVPKLENSRIYAYCSTEYIKDMGTPERLKAVEKDVKSGMTAARSIRNKQKAIFLDRDGTINKEDGFIRTAGQVKLIPNAAKAIAKINKSEYLAICATNQPVIARGEVSFDELDEIHARLDTLLGQDGAYLDGLFFCPHHPDRGFENEQIEYKITCDCRKPKAGLLFQAAEKYNIDLSQSYMIGDSTADILAGQTAGCRTVGVKTGVGLSDKKYDVSPDMVCTDLAEAVHKIIDGSDVILTK